MLFKRRQTEKNKFPNDFKDKPKQSNGNSASKCLFNPRILAQRATTLSTQTLLKRIEEIIVQ